MGDVFQSATTPGECAILIAPPLTYSDFISDVRAADISVSATKSRGEYANQIVHSLRHGGNAEKAWEEDGSEVAALCNQLINDARSVGVRVEERATISGLRQCVADGFRVIVLVAHWKGPEINAGDLRVDEIGRLKEAIQNPADSLDRSLADHTVNLIDASDTAYATSRIADALCRVIGAETGIELSGNGSVDLRGPLNAPEAADPAGRIRDALDERLSGFLVPGNCIEFRDGYHKPSDIAGAFHDDWFGVVELSVCFSMVLATAISRDWDNRRVIANETAKNPERCLPELMETFLRLSVETRNYLDLRGEVFSNYSQLLRAQQGA